MPRSTPVLPTVSGRRQAGRPALKAATPVDAERALPGALSAPIEQIVPDPGQPRRDMDGARLAELAASLKEHGVLQPLLVREDGYLEDGRTRYMIVAGGRRHAAARQAGLVRLPVVVRDSEGAALRVTQLIENVHRQDLAPLEEARAFQELMDAEGLNAEELGERLHVSGQKVRDRLLLLTDQVVADAVLRAQIPVTVAAEILRLPAEGQEQLRPSIEAGAAVDRATVREIRDELKAAGVANPRTKGGGRPKNAVRQPPQARPDNVNYQCGIDNERPTTGGAAFSTTVPPSPMPTPTTAQSTPRATPTDGVRAAPDPLDRADAAVAPARVKTLYAQFQDWRARVYGELDDLPADERRTLLRLVRDDVEHLFRRLDEADPVVRP